MLQEINQNLIGNKEILKQEKIFASSNAIVELENLFFQEKNGELYRILMEVVEKPIIENILHRTEGNKLKTARILGINRNTLHAKIKKLKINVDDFKQGGLSMGK